MRAAAILAISATLVLAAWITLSPRADSAGRASLDANAADSLPRRPSARQMGQWLKASNDKLAARAEDYKIDAPRRRDKNGQALPFRERSWPSSQQNAWARAAEGDLFVLPLFRDVELRARVTGRWQDGEGTRVAASLEGRGPRDRFFMSTGKNFARGLVELPSVNRAYEILSDDKGGFLVREWLYTDVVCATPVPGGGADAGIPKKMENSPALSAPIAPGEVPQLESRAGAAGVIYMDFDGEVVSGTAWANGATINAPPARMNAAQVRETWERVSRHYSPFDVNVTTIRSVYEAAPANRRTHCVVTEVDTAAPGAGGVAYLDSFANPDPSTKICWSFIDDSAPDCALVVSHEVGHTLDLSHDGYPQNPYYPGHGTGITGWGPFMGAPYGKNLLQWSKGEYQGANNPEDDLAIITAPARIPYLNDDHGGSTASATPLTSGQASSGSIERNTDADFFRVLVGTGPQPVSVALPVGTMLDVELGLFAEDGSPIETVNPAGELVASTVLNFSAPRTVFIRVVGTGKPPVTGTGYSAYSSLGPYTLTAGNPFPGRVSGVVAAPVSDTAIDLSWPPAAAAVSYIVRRNGADIATTSALSVRDSGLSEQTAYTYTVVASNGTGAAQPSDLVTATTFDWWRANPFGFRVTDPAVLTSTNATNFVFAGRMGPQLAGALVQWTNVGRGASGYLASPGTNWSSAISLQSGTNRIVFSTSYGRVTGTNVFAYDSAGASQYDSGWVSGANGGYGFGAWSNSISSANASLEIVDEFAAPSMRVGKFEGFALRGRMGASAVARRSFGRPLAVGESFTINFDSNLIDAGRSVGFSLADGGGTNRLSFSAAGGSQNVYVIRDGSGTNTNTGIAYTTNGLLPVTVTVLTNNGYRLVAGTNPPVTGSLSTGGSLGALVVSNGSAGSGEQRSFYLGDMSILSLVTTNQPVVVAAPLVVQSSTTPALTDGIPDDWWNANGIPAGQRLASADADGDGLTNAQEYSAGTSPTDPGSKLVITSFGRLGNTVSVSWSAVSGKAYVLETRASLSTGWQTAISNIVATNTGTIATNLSLLGQEGFLRVRLEP